MSLWSWIWDNKEWLFSGGGVALMAALYSLRRKKTPSSTTTHHDLLIGQVMPLLPETPSRGWTLFENFPGMRGLAQRRIYTEARVSQNLRFLVHSENEGMTFFKNGNEGNVRVWIDAVNLNPFPIEIDRITGQLLVNNCSVATINVSDRFEIPAIKWASINFEVMLSASQVNGIELQLKQQSNVTAGVQAKFYLENRVRKFPLMRTFQSGNCRFLNFKIE